MIATGKRLSVLLLLSMTWVFLVSCSANGVPTPAMDRVVDEATMEVEESTPPVEPTMAATKDSTLLLAEDQSEPEPTQEVEPSPTPTKVVIVDADSACVECHTDEEQLKALASEPEEVHLSSGEG